MWTRVGPVHVHDANTAHIRGLACACMCVVCMYMCVKKKGLCIIFPLCVWSSVGMSKCVGVWWCGPVVVLVEVVCIWVRLGLHVRNLLFGLIGHRK